MAIDIRLQKQIVAWEHELDGWKAEKDNLERRIATRERLLRTLHEEAELDGAGRSNGHSRPGTSKAIIVVLEAAGRPLTAREVYDELQRRHWLPLDAKDPRHAVKAGLWTLGKNHKITKIGDTPAERRWAAKTSSPTRPPQDGEAVG